MTEFVALGHEEVPAPAFKPGMKLRHKGWKEQKARVSTVIPYKRGWSYGLMIKVNDVPAYMSNESLDWWDEEDMGVWEEDTDASV